LAVRTLAAALGALSPHCRLVGSTGRIRRAQARPRLLLGPGADRGHTADYGVHGATVAASRAPVADPAYYARGPLVRALRRALIQRIAARLPRDTGSGQYPQRRHVFRRPPRRLAWRI